MQKLITLIITNCFLFTAVAQGYTYARANKSVSTQHLRVPSGGEIETLFEMGFLEEPLKKVDPRIVNIGIEQVIPPSDPNKFRLWNGEVAKPFPRLIVAINEAVIRQIPNIGIGKDVTDSEKMRELKKKIDNDATKGFEKVMSGSEQPMEIASGEGEGEKLPGPRMGQRFGGEGSPLYAVVDVVDGTTLVAKGLKGNKVIDGSRGALSLGALCRAVGKFPDMQAYAILLPEGISGINFEQPIENNLENNLKKIAGALGKKVTDLTCLSELLATR